MIPKIYPNTQKYSIYTRSIGYFGYPTGSLAGFGHELKPADPK